MKTFLLVLLTLLTSISHSQTQSINIKGFGEMSATKNNDNSYDLDFGKYGRFNAKGTIDPLSLTIKTTLDNLKQFPGHKLYKKLGLQNSVINIKNNGVSLGANIDAAKNFGPVWKMFKIKDPTMEINISVSTSNIQLEGTLDFQANPIVIDIIPEFSRLTIEKLNLGSELAVGDGEFDFNIGFDIQTHWKPTQWDPDILSITQLSYNLTSNEISIAISMTDTWSNPLLLKKILKQENAVVFTDVAASVDWPIGSPSPSGIGLYVGKASFFDLDFAVQLAITPLNKQVAVYASRNKITMNDFSRILRNGFGLKVPDIFPNNISIDNVEILFSPNGGKVGVFEIKKVFSIIGNANFLEAANAQVAFTADDDNGIELYYKLDAAFKKYFEHEFRNHPKLKYISGQLLKTLEVRQIELQASADKNLYLTGKTKCDFSVLGKKIKFEIEGAFSVDAILNQALDEVLKIAGPEVSAAINAIGSGVKDASKIANAAVGLGAGVAKKYVKLGAIKSKHIHPFDGGEKYCRKHCIPNRANHMAAKVLPNSLKSIRIFHDKIINDLIRIEGPDPESTKKMREELFLKEWNELNKKIENDWDIIRSDEEYVGYFVDPKWATKGGKQYRGLIDDKKKEYTNLRNSLYKNLITAKSKEQIQSKTEYSRIKNRWKQTYLHIENGFIECSNIAPGWHSAMWIIEPVSGTSFVRIKNRWKNTYLNIETGNIQCTDIQSGWYSAMWEIIPIIGTNYYRIKNRWKETFLHIESGTQQFTDIQDGWHSAMWEIEGGFE